MTKAVHLVQIELVIPESVPSAVEKEVTGSQSQKRQDWEL